MTHEEWLEARKHGIGASDAASILGLNSWKSNISLWEEKTGRAAAPDIGDKPQVKYGKAAGAVYNTDTEATEVSEEPPALPDGRLYLTGANTAPDEQEG